MVSSYKLIILVVFLIIAQNIVDTDKVAFVTLRKRAYCHDVGFRVHEPFLVLVHSLGFLLFSLLVDVAVVCCLQLLDLKRN